MQRQPSPEALALGDVIRRRRRSLGLTLVQVAELSGLSHPFLSQLERGRTRGSMRSLFLVAEALRTSQQALLAEASNDGAAPVVPSQAGSARLLTSVPGYFDVSEFTSAPHEFSDFYVHAHEEFLYLAAGTLEVELGEAGSGPVPTETTVHALNPRDWMRWPGGVPHRFRTTGEAPSLLLLVHAPRV
jgi:transcriptional regulator with XRE-family HTH domain